MEKEYFMKKKLCYMYNWSLYYVEINTTLCQVNISTFQFKRFSKETLRVAMDSLNILWPREAKV